MLAKYYFEVKKEYGYEYAEEQLKIAKEAYKKGETDGSMSDIACEMYCQMKKEWDTDKTIANKA